MKSGYSLYWSAEALKNLRNIISYLGNNWSEKEVRNFFTKLDRRLNLINLNPRLFPETEFKKNVRRSVLTKHIVIYYLFKRDVVKILTLFDTRQDPARLRL